MASTHEAIEQLALEVLEGRVARKDIVPGLYAIGVETTVDSIVGVTSTDGMEVVVYDMWNPLGLPIRQWVGGLATNSKLNYEVSFLDKLSAAIIKGWNEEPF